MKISISELEDLTARAVRSYGYSEDEVRVISDALLYAQLRGNNQGVVKLVGKGIPRDPAAGEITVEKETPISVRINGNRNHAMVVVRKATDIVAEKARKRGFGLAGTWNTNTSSGAIGYFAAELARQGLIGFLFGRSPERVAMHGAFEPVFGTNPLAVGIPADPDPIVLDMSTAAISFYGLVEAETAGGTIPPDVAWNTEGRPTTSPREAIGGAIRSFDRGHKGSSLALIGEILAGPLVGAAFCGTHDSKENWGHLLFAIDPGILGDRDEFVRNVVLLCRKVKGSRKLPGVEEIFLPGERGSLLARQRLARDEIEVEDNLLAALRKIACF